MVSLLKDLGTFFFVFLLSFDFFNPDLSTFRKTQKSSKTNF